MKLKSFNYNNVPVGYGRKPILYINVETGAFRFNVSASQLIGIGGAKRVSIHQDEDKTEDMYVSLDMRGFPVRVDAPKDNENMAYVFKNKALAETLFADLTNNSKSLRVPIGREPVNIDGTKYWPLITAALKGGKND
jgi:hypothetical protein